MPRTDLKNKLIVNVLMALSVLFVYSTGWTATYFVNKYSSNASDSSTGTESMPFLTIQHGVNKAIAGDSVLVKAGVYYESIVMKNSGTVENPITIKNFKNDVVTVDGSKNSDIFLVNWKGSGTAKHHIVWDGINVRKGSKYGLWIEGDYNTIKNSIIYNNGGPNEIGHTGLQAMRTKHLTVTNNELYGNGWNGMAIEDSANATISYNFSHDNLYHNGIDVKPSPGREPHMQENNNIHHNASLGNKNGMYLRYQKYNTVANNVFADNKNNGIYISYSSEEPERLSIYPAYTKFYNNTITGNGLHGIYDESATHLTIKNNIFSDNSNCDIFVNNGKTAGHVIDHNLYFSTVKFKWGSSGYISSLSGFRDTARMEANGLEADPKFKDRANNDYTLASGSGAIDVGLDLRPEGITEDKDGTPRPQGAGFDAGAFESTWGTK